MSVYEDVALPLKLKQVKGIKKKVESTLSQVGILHLKDSLPKNLSGGQRQRVGIARALAYNTDIILMDEPFSALDIKTSEELHKDILDLWQKTGKTIVIISHLLEEAVLLGQEIVLLKNGKILKKFQNSLEYPRNGMSHDFLN
jgi:ABC-type nitrate/sulfonate/bicarbonate transport system ATPase subunit